MWFWLCFVSHSFPAFDTSDFDPSNTHNAIKSLGRINLSVSVSVYICFHMCITSFSYLNIFTRITLITRISPLLNHLVAISDCSYLSISLSHFIFLYFNLFIYLIVLGLLGVYFALVIVVPAKARVNVKARLSNIDW